MIVVWMVCVAGDGSGVEVLMVEVVIVVCSGDGGGCVWW